MAEAGPAGPLGLPPRLVLAGAVLAGAALLVVGAEVLLALVEGDSIYQHQEIERRYIRLKEHHPGTRNPQFPIAQHLRQAHTLERKEYVLEADENGFIRPSRVHDEADLEIFFLGGSTTECFYVTAEKRFPYLVGRRLEERLGLRVNSYNGGVSGNNSLHSIDILINKVLPLKPDVVLFLHNANDLNILLYEGGYWNQHKYRSPLVTIREQSGQPRLSLPARCKLIVRTLLPHLYRRCALAVKRAQGGPEEVDEFAHVRGTTVAYDPAFLEDSFRKNLRTFVGIARAAGFLPVLITQANRFTDDPGPVVRLMLQGVASAGIPYPDYKRLYDRFNEVIREVGREQDVLVIDLAREIPQSETYMYDAMHFNDAGSELAASLVTDALADHLR